MTGVFPTNLLNQFRSALVVALQDHHPLTDTLRPLLPFGHRDTVVQRPEQDFGMDFTDHLARSSVCPQESIYLGDLVQDVECLLAESLT